MSGVPVVKMHGTYNDFAVIDARDGLKIDDLPTFAREVCDRRGGVGADGLILIESSESGGARMRIVNADGSEAEMCGNGLRCAARYLSERGEGDRLRIETASGIIPAEIMSRGETFQIRVQLNTPRFERRALPFQNAAYVVVGNPHVVIFESSLDAIDLSATAMRLQGIFPDGVNVHLTVPVDAHRLDARHWERGVGPTHACGTGAAACAAAAIDRGLASSPLDVHVPGGILQIEWDGQGAAFLTGPAARVFETTIAIPHAASV